MLDELYEDVLSVMKEYGFVDWFNKTHPDKVSPLKWCYDTECTLKAPKAPPKNIKWIAFTYDSLINYPNRLYIDKDGVGPYGL
jgi:hypothetical protein